MSKILGLIKVRYKDNKFYLLEVNSKKVKGLKLEVDCVTFVAINKNLECAEKSKTLHRLIKEHHNVHLFCLAGSVVHK